MKKLFLACMLLLAISQFEKLATAQGIDRSVAEQGSVIILETGKQWNNTTQVNYIFRPPFGYNVINLFIRNNSVGLSHNPTITLAETSDAFISGYAGNTTKWDAAQSIGYGVCGALSPLGSVSIGAQSTSVCSFILRNSAQVEISFTSDGGDPNSTYDLVLNFATTGGGNFSLMGGVDMITTVQPVRPISVDPQGRVEIAVNAGAFSNQQSTSPLYVALNVAGGANPCLLPAVSQTSQTLIQSSVPINITTATTVQLFSTGGAKGNLCDFSFTMTGTGTQTAKFVTGSGTNCGTGTTDLTGDYTTSATTGFLVTGNFAAQVPSTQAICLTTTGTTVVVKGYAHFVRGQN